MADITYSVVAPLVVVRNSEQGGRHEYLYQGALVPGYVSAEDVQRLQTDGLIAPVAGALHLGVTPATSPDQLNRTVLVPAADGKEEPQPKATAPKAAKQ